MKMIVLVGLPGSGKSTLCSQFPDYVRINQDDLGSKENCVVHCQKALDAGKNVVIDRTNVDTKQRRTWIKLAQDYGIDVSCVYIDITDDEAFHRINLRKNHPTISETMSSDKKRSIINFFLRDLTIPSLDEGFKNVLLVRG